MDKAREEAEAELKAWEDRVAQEEGHRQSQTSSASMTPPGSKGAGTGWNEKEANWRTHEVFENIRKATQAAQQRAAQKQRAEQAAAQAAQQKRDEEALRRAQEDRKRAEEARAVIRRAQEEREILKRVGVAAIAFFVLVVVVMALAGGGGWNPPCNFAGIPKPNEASPATNPPSCLQHLNLHQVILDALANKELLPGCRTGSVVRDAGGYGTGGIVNLSCPEHGTSTTAGLISWGLPPQMEQVASTAIACKVNKTEWRCETEEEGVYVIAEAASGAEVIRRYNALVNVANEHGEN